MKKTTPYKKFKITVKTPKNQAKPCMIKQRDALLGFKKQKNILEEKLVNNHEFYWIIPIDDDNDAMQVTKRLAKGETQIKKFYKTLIKTLDRINKLANKFKKGATWIKNKLIKKLNKDQQTEFAKQVQEMTEEEILDFIKINDRKEMMQLLAGELITIKEIK